MGNFLICIQSLIMKAPERPPESVRMAPSPEGTPSWWVGNKKKKRNKKPANQPFIFPRGPQPLSIWHHHRGLHGVVANLALRSLHSTTTRRPVWG